MAPAGPRPCTATGRRCSGRPRWAARRISPTTAMRCWWSRAARPGLNRLWPRLRSCFRPSISWSGATAASAASAGAPAALISTCSGAASWHRRPPAWSCRTPAGSSEGSCWHPCWRSSGSLDGRSGCRCHRPLVDPMAVGSPAVVPMTQAFWPGLWQPVAPQAMAQQAMAPQTMSPCPSPCHLARAGMQAPPDPGERRESVSAHPGTGRADPVLSPSAPMVSTKNLQINGVHLRSVEHNSWVKILRRMNATSMRVLSHGQLHDSDRRWSQLHLQ